ncbi:MAG: bacillithiol system redox-active protein YtxJ [Candidatus Hydrogenedentes bacterium]|nr:bacillithiol system redox-active protein YtxJ [Candidatus Hydrogenedentota bacterium]
MSLLAWLQGMIRGAGAPLEDLGVISMTTQDELAQAIEHSHREPVFIFKHSTSCPISSAAHQRVRKYIEQAGENAPAFYLVKVIESRPVSNEIAQRLGVTHQSPQLILVRDGKRVWDRSHGAIDAASIDAALG